VSGVGPTLCGIVCTRQLLYSVGTLRQLVFANGYVSLRSIPIHLDKTCALRSIAAAVGGVKVVHDVVGVA